MKKMILAVIVMVMISGPALGSEFKALQTRMLETITTLMEQYKDDVVKSDLLTHKKECTEKAVNMEDLKVCVSKYPTEYLNPAVSNN